MGCSINYWSCKYENYDGSPDSLSGFDERFYGCSNDNCGAECDLDNKYNDEEQYCEFAEHKETMD